jgi:epoxyqueuosine reductase
MDYKKSIINFCSSLGIDTVGFCECRTFDELRPFLENRKIKKVENEFEEKNIEKRINPKLLLHSGETIISLGFPYLYNFDKHAPIYFSKYTWGRDYHLVLSN